jgi:hypothetical protein
MRKALLPNNDIHTYFQRSFNNHAKVSDSIEAYLYQYQIQHQPEVKG